jgi:hypothetical protein
MSVYVAELFLTCSASPTDIEATLVHFDQRWTQPIARSWSRLVYQVPDDATFLARINTLVRNQFQATIVADLAGMNVQSIQDTFAAGIWKPGQGGIHIGYAGVYANVVGQGAVQWRIPQAPQGFGFVSAAVTWKETNVIN